MKVEKGQRNEKSIMSNMWKYKYFVDVIENKSFTKAGNINYVSQTAVSQNISGLEKSIGGKLIDRGGGELRLTELGEIVYRNAKQILEIENQMFQEVERFRNQLTVWVGIDSSINKKLWLTIENVYETYFLEKMLKFTKVDCMEAASRLENRSLDIFIGYRTRAIDEIPGVKGELLAHKEVGIYVGNNTTIPHGNVRLEQLKGHQYFKTRKYEVSIQEEAEEYLKDSCRVIEVGNMETMKLMVEFNDGVAFVDSYYFYQDDGEIRSLIDYKRKCEIRMYCREDSNKKEVRQFMKKLKKKMEV